MSSLEAHITNALILAAGRGSRLKDLTETIPKCLVEIDGEALLHKQLRTLKIANIQKVYAVTGYKKELLTSQFFGTFENTRWSGTNMVYSLLQASALLESSPCLILYSDILYESRLIQSLCDFQSDFALPYLKNWEEVWRLRFDDPLSDAETFKLDPSQKRLVEIGKKPQSLLEIEGQFMGIIKFTPTGWSRTLDLIQAIPYETIDKMDCTTLLNLTISKGVGPELMPFTGSWFEIDSQEDISAFRKAKFFNQLCNQQ